MLIAATTNTETGRKRLVLGLQEENVRRLRNDEPLYQELRLVPGLEDWDVSVLGPEDTVRFVAAHS